MPSAPVESSRMLALGVLGALELGSHLLLLSIAEPRSSLPALVSSRTRIHRLLSNIMRTVNEGNTVCDSK